jgi:sodium transport system ATP-binding protein
MTAWEMVEYFGRLYGIPNDRLEARMLQVFEELSMLDYRNVAGARMSTGMRQKVSIARALVHDPPVLIFDEASLGLDVIVARALLEIIARLRDQGKCIIFSTHVMREVERLCDRVAILYRGRILANGTLEDLANQYGEADFEEMFFTMLHQSDRARQAQVAEALHAFAIGGNKS